jgi:hypothetical protein
MGPRRNRKPFAGTRQRFGSAVATDVIAITPVRRVGSGRGSKRLV